MWCNQGAVCVVDGINTTYWTAGDQLVGEIPGTVFNEFMSNVPSLNSTYLYYELWDIFHKWGGHQYLQSMTCADFCWVIFQEIYRVGGRFNCSVTARHDFINLYVEEVPQQVLFKDKSKEIIDFYSHFQWKRGESITDILLNALESIFDDHFVYNHNQYYKIHFHFPYIGYEWAQQSLPGCPKP